MPAKVERRSHEVRENRGVCENLDYDYDSDSDNSAERILQWTRSAHW
jgi:hypothetical protein